MLQIIAIISFISLHVSLMAKWPRPGLYLLKTANLMLLLFRLFFALFLTIMGLCEQRLHTYISSHGENMQAIVSSEHRL